MECVVYVIRFLKKWATTQKFKKVKKSIIKAGYDIGDIDKENLSLLVNHEEFSLLVSLDPETKTIEFNSTIIFDGDLGNLKTLSSLAHTAFYYKFTISGLSHKSNCQTRLYLEKELDYSSVKKVGFVTQCAHQCIDTIVRYLHYRHLQNDLDNLDLSMFEDIDLFLFDPKGMGEKKDFQFGDWTSYSSSVSRGEIEMIVDSEIMINEIEACAKFEQANNMLLSEVGDRILEELVWNRQMKDLSVSDDYSIN